MICLVAGNGGLAAVPLRALPAVVGIVVVVFAHTSRGTGAMPSERMEEGSDMCRRAPEERYRLEKTV